jgi:hypothetical protein
MRIFAAKMLSLYRARLDPQAPVFRYLNGCLWQAVIDSSYNRRDLFGNRAIRHVASGA